MSSPHPNEAFQSNDNTSCSNMFRFVKMRPIATAAKKLVSKIKSVRIFRSRSSTYVPFREWEAQYLSENPQFETGRTTLDSEVDCEESEKGILTKVLRISEYARFHDENQIFPSEHMSETSVRNLPDSHPDRTCNEYSVKEGNAAEESGVQTLSDITIVKEIEVCSQGQKTGIRCDSLLITETPSEPVENVTAETVKNETTSSIVSPEDAVGDENSANATSGYFSRVLSDSEQASSDSKTNWSQLRSETVDTVVSDITDRGEVQECTDNNGETTSNPANDLQQSNLESCHAQIDSNDSDLSNIRAGMSLMDVGVHNDTSAVVASTARGNGVEKICEAAENCFDHGERSQNVQECKKHVLDPAPSEDLSKPEIKNFDPEKAARIQRLRKRVAFRNEARLRRAQAYAEREAQRNRDAGLECSGVKSPSTSSPFFAEGFHVTPASETELKTGSGSCESTETFLESARWSRKYAEEARERRKRNQKELLLSPTEQCSTKN